MYLSSGPFIFGLYFSQTLLSGSASFFAGHKCVFGGEAVYEAVVSALHVLSAFKINASFMLFLVAGFRFDRILALLKHLIEVCSIILLLFF